MFKEELQYEGENLGFAVLLVDAFDTRHVLGRSIVNLSLMLAHQCSIVRLETDLYADDKEEEPVGSITCDVRGHTMLLRAQKEE